MKAPRTSQGRPAREFLSAELELLHPIGLDIRLTSDT